MSGFERVERDPWKAQLRARLHCGGDERGRDCGKEIARAYEEQEFFIFRGKGGLLPVKDGQPQRSIPLKGASKPQPSIEDVPGLEALFHKAREASVRKAPLGRLVVKTSELRTMLLEVYCPEHDLRRIWAEQVRLAAIRAKRAVEPQTLNLRVFSVPWPLGADPQEWPAWNYSGRSQRPPLFVRDTPAWLPHKR